MAKKQTRRSISVSRVTYERLKAFCETNNISMSQLVETRVNDFLGHDAADADRTVEQPVARTFERPAMASPMTSSAPSAFRPMTAPVAPIASRAPISQPAPMARPIERPMTAPVASHTSVVVASQPVERPMTAPVVAQAPTVSSTSTGASTVAPAPTVSTPAPAASPAVPMTSAAARFAVEPPPPIIKPRQDTAAPKPAEKRPDQIFTF